MIRLNRHFIASLAVVAGLAYAPSAIGGFNPGPIQVNKPAAAATSDHNSKPGPDLPAEATCDLHRLTGRLDGFEGQKEALAQKLKHLGASRIAFESTLNSKALADVDAQIEQTQHRIAALDKRIKAVTAQIDSCQGKEGGKPGSSGGDGSSGNAGSDSTDRDLKADMRISCKVPSGAETKSILFRNVGQKLIPSGTPVTWYIKAGGQGGKFSLPRDLAAGAELTAAELLKLGVPGDTSCRSKL